MSYSISHWLTGWNRFKFDPELLILHDKRNTDIDSSFTLAAVNWKVFLTYPVGWQVFFKIFMKKY